MNTGSQTQFEQSYRRRRLIRRIVIVLLGTIISGLIGQAYGNVFYGGDLHDAYRGFRTGASIGFISTVIEVFYIRADRRNWVRRSAFLPALIVRILVLTLFIRLCLVGNELISDYITGNPLQRQLDIGVQIRDTLFSMAAVIVFVVLSQLTSIIGFKRFVNLVVGRYFKPVREDRLFLFVDLLGSTELARSLGDKKFHECLSEFFYQLDIAIVSTGGEIVSYIGDAVIITWPLTGNKTKNARCLTALQAMLFRLRRSQRDFEQRFNYTPAFRAAIHGGPVVVGECGNSRRQVTFLGDAINITSRIEELSKIEGDKFLASDSMLQQMEIPPGVQIEPFGEFKFKGADETFSLSRIVL